MQRVLIWFKLYGCEAVRYKLKNGLKTQKMHFLPVFELTLASLMAIWVEQNQCPLHQSILLTQGPIRKIFMKKYWELTILKNSLFLSQLFWISFSFGLFFFFFASFLWKQVYFLARSKFWSSQFWHQPNILTGSVILQFEKSISAVHHLVIAGFITGCMVVILLLTY